MLHSIDIDECATNNGGCDQNCHNTAGSYYCTCNTGFLLDDDDHGCSGEYHFILKTIAIALHDLCGQIFGVINLIMFVWNVIISCYKVS